MGKRLQVQAQVAPVGAAVKPLRQLDRVGAGQSVVTGLLGRLDQRARPGATVEVIVQQHLGCGRNLEVFGYGVKGFTLSMIETAIMLSDGAVGGDEIARIPGCTCATTTDTAKCWGRDSEGQLGNGTTNDQPPPNQVAAVTECGLTSPDVVDLFHAYWRTHA